MRLTKRDFSGIPATITLPRENDHPLEGPHPTD
mgnify:CR=1 FL=1